MNAVTDNFEKDLSDELSKDFPNAPKLKHEPVPIRPATGTSPAKVENDAERYLSHIDSLIRSLRSRMLETETEYVRERTHLLQQTADRIKQMDRDNAERQGRLRGMLAKLEAAKDA